MREQLVALRALARLHGSNNEFLVWVRTQKSCISGKFSEWPDGEARNPACHVRRAVDSGTSHKPDYSAVPMTNQEHADQTNRGEQYCLNIHSTSYPWTVEAAKEFFDRQVIAHLNRWLKS